MVSLVDKVAALANTDQARKRSDSPSMEFRGKMIVLLDRRERRRRCCMCHPASSLYLINVRGAAHWHSETPQPLRTPESPGSE